MKKYALVLLISLFVYVSCSSDDNGDPEPIVNIVKRPVPTPGSGSISIAWELGEAEGIDYIKVSSSIEESHIAPTETGKTYSNLDPTVEYTFAFSTVYLNGDESDSIQIKATPGELVVELPDAMVSLEFDNSLENTGLGTDPATTIIAESTPVYVEGHNGQAYKIDLTNSLQIPAYDGMEGNMSFTYSAWVNIKDITESEANGTILSLGANGAALRATLKLENGNLRLEYGNGAELAADENARIADDAWHHVAATFNGSQIELWVDGVLIENVTLFGQGTDGADVTLAIQTTPIVIGTRQVEGPGDDNQILQGLLIDDLKVFNEALSGEALIELSQL